MSNPLPSPCAHGVLFDCPDCALLRKIRDGLLTQSRNAMLIKDVATSDACMRVISTIDGMFGSAYPYTAEHVAASGRSASADNHSPVPSPTSPAVEQKIADLYSAIGEWRRAENDTMDAETVAIFQRLSTSVKSLISVVQSQAAIQALDNMNARLTSKFTPALNAASAMDALIIVAEAIRELKTEEEDRLARLQQGKDK